MMSAFHLDYLITNRGSRVTTSSSVHISSSSSPPPPPSHHHDPRNSSSHSHHPTLHPLATHFLTSPTCPLRRPGRSEPDPTHSQSYVFSRIHPLLNLPFMQIPWWCLVAFGAYSLGSLGLGLVRFRDCPEAYEELLKVRPEWTRREAFTLRVNVFV